MEESAAKPEPTTKPARDPRVLARAAGSVSAMFFLAIVLMANYLAFRHYRRIDWTSQGIFTLSPKSQSVLRGVSKDIDVYVFLARGESGYTEADELLARYRAANRMIRVHHVDPDRQPAEFKLLAQRFGIAAGVIETGEARADVAAVVAQGDKSWHVSRDDLVAMDFGGANDGEQEINIKAEQALTGAIVQVTSGRATKVCVTSGHGEWSVEDGAERSLSGLKEGLHHDNIKWEAFETLGKKEVPKDCDLVAVLGPLRAVSGAEAKLLFDYLRAGGNLWLALDPVIERDQVSVTGLEDELARVGIRLDRSLALELSAEHLLSPNAAEFVVTEFGDHETTRSMQHAARVFMTLARSVSVTGSSPDVEVLLRGSAKSFGKTALAQLQPSSDPVRAPGDIEGPVQLALAVQLGKGDAAARKTGGRLIVVGDSDFLQQPLLASPELANFHLASAWTGWLAERPALVQIPPKKIKSGNIVWSQEDMGWLLLRVAVLIPGAAFVLGLAVWLNRRR